MAVTGATAPMRTQTAAANTALAPSLHCAPKPERLTLTKSFRVSDACRRAVDGGAP